LVHGEHAALAGSPFRIRLLLAWCERQSDVVLRRSSLPIGAVVKAPSAALQCWRMKRIDLMTLRRDILMGPIGMGISMMSAYIFFLALFTRHWVMALCEDGRQFLAAQHIELHLELNLQPAPMVLLNHEHLGHHNLSFAHLTLNATQANRVIMWAPCSIKSSWPGSAAVSRAP